MEIITFDSEVYRELKKSLDTISNYVLNKEDKQGEEDWVDEYDVCTYLKISRRTLQRIRYENLLTYSLVRWYLDTSLDIRLFHNNPCL